MTIQTATLPISEADDGLRLDEAEAKALGTLLHSDYVNAEPFPHIVLDDVLPLSLAQRILRNFPREDLPSDRHFNINYGGHLKRQVSPEDCNAFVRSVFHLFNSRPVIAFLEGLTGIEGLLPDPFFEGGGFHEISAGGKLGNSDFGPAWARATAGSNARRGVASAARHTAVSAGAARRGPRARPSRSAAVHAAAVGRQPAAG